MSACHEYKLIHCNGLGLEDLGSAAPRPPVQNRGDPASPNPPSSRADGQVPSGQIRRLTKMSSLAGHIVQEFEEAESFNSYQYFGTIPRAMFTLLNLVLLSDDWFVATAGL